MTVYTKDCRFVYLRRLNTGDLDNLYYYLQGLSAEMGKRFGPHSFDKQAIVDFYVPSNLHNGYIAQLADTNEMVAYSIIKTGFLEHDYQRLSSYNITPPNNRDCVFAPSVADAWQGNGLGNKLFAFILTELKDMGISRVILWGGVQVDNDKAVQYYKRNGFRTLGQFSYHGENYDMVLDI